MGHERGEPRRRFPLWPFAVVAVLALVALVIVQVVLERRQDGVDSFDHYVAEAELGDGSILTLRAVTYGDHHELPLKRPKTGLMGWGSGNGHVPEFLERDTDADSVILWFSRRDGRTGKTMDFSWWKRCSVVDAHDWKIKDRYARQDCFSNTSGRSSLMSGGVAERPSEGFNTGECDVCIASSTLPSFRPSGKTFTLQVHDVQGEVVAEFEVPWPGPGTLPVWTPETLPATKTVGDLEVTLNALTVEENHSETSEGYDLHAKADIDIRDMASGAEWHVDQVLFEDALGNASDDYDCTLSPLESAWKVTALMSRNEDGPPLTSETWHVGKIQLPADGTTTDLALSGSSGGVPISVEAIGGRGLVTYLESATGLGKHDGGSVFTGDNPCDNFSIVLNCKGSTCRRTIKSNVPHLMLDVPHLTRLQSLRIQAVDDAGRAVDGTDFRSNEKAYWFFSPPPGSTSIDLTIIITQKREVEFLAAPQLVTAEE